MIEVNFILHYIIWLQRYIPMSSLEVYLKTQMILWLNYIRKEMNIMTAYELSESKVRFKRVWESFFEKESNDDSQYVLTQNEYNTLINKLEEGIEIIDEYLKEKG